MTIFKKYTLLGITAIVAIITIYGYSEFNRKPEDLTNVKPQAIVTADSVVAAYENDEVVANKQFLGKTIMVNGMVTEINNQQDTLLNITLGDSNYMHKVSCLLDKQQLDKLKQYSVGKLICIKGICTGFLADVELNRCVIVNAGK